MTNLIITDINETLERSIEGGYSLTYEADLLSDNGILMFRVKFKSRIQYPDHNLFRWVYNKWKNRI